MRGFAFDDVDGDGQPELAVDVVTKTPQTTFRTMTPYDAFVRTVGWYRADLTPQYESALCEWSTESIEEEEGGESTARRIRLEDHDGDGRADLVIACDQHNVVSHAHLPTDSHGCVEVDRAGRVDEGVLSDI